MILQSQILSQPNLEGEDTTTREAIEILRRAFPPSRPPEGFVMGRTQMRNALADEARCSLLHAEELIKRLQDRGLIQFSGKPLELETGPPYWTIER